MRHLRAMIPKAKAFFKKKDQIWQIRPESLPLFRALGVKLLRISMIAVNSFREHQCVLRASALTFYTILSIVPVAAMAFGIAQGFGVEKMLADQLLQNFPGQEKVISQVIAYADSMLKNTRGGVIAGIGVGLLFWTVIKVLGHIEMSFNAIWHVKTPRSLPRKVSDYLAMMILAPICLIMAGSVTVFIRTQIIHITQQIELLGLFSPLIFFGLRFIPYILVWMLFTIIYMVMPNTRIAPASGLFAGVIAGTVYQIVQWAYITFQVGVAGQSAIYGSFAALPLFLVWLQTSWIIVLAGAVISASYQKAAVYDFVPNTGSVGAADRRLNLLRIVLLIVRCFTAGKPPVTEQEIAVELGIPAALISEILGSLERGGLMSRVVLNEGEKTGWQPGRDTELLTVKAVIDALEQGGQGRWAAIQDESVRPVAEILAAFDAAMESSPANRRIKDI